MTSAIRRILPCGLFLVCLALAAPVRADEKVYQKLLPGAVFIDVKLNNGQNPFGSGVLVDAERKLVVTNCHNVRDQEHVAIAFPARENGKLMSDKTYYGQNYRKLFIPGKVIFRDMDRDVAVVQLSELPPDAQAVPLAPQSAAPGQTVHLIGNPATEPALWVYSYGKVRQVCHKVYPCTTPDGYKVTLNCQAVLTTIPVNPGDSGGPVVNDRGELIGLAQSFVSTSNDMSVLIDVSEIRTVLAQAEKISLAKK
jgi:S1-C subfamily serine protease